MMEKSPCGKTNRTEERFETHFAFRLKGSTSSKHREMANNNSINWGLEVTMVDSIKKVYPLN